MRLGMWRSGSLPAMFELKVTPLCPGAAWSLMGGATAGTGPGHGHGNALRPMSNSRLSRNA